MKGGALLLTAWVVAVAAGTGAAKPRPTPTPAPSPVPSSPRVAVTAVSDGRRADLEFDGALLGWAAPSDPRGQRAIFVLVAPPVSPLSSAEAASCTAVDAQAPDAARDARLFRWSLEAPETLTLVASAWPRGSLDTADLDGDGSDELMLRGDGTIDAIEFPSQGRLSASLRPLVRDATLGSSVGDPRAARSLADAADGGARVVVPGELRTYRRNESGGLALSGAVELPVRVQPGRARLGVETPGVVTIGRGASGRMLFATRPEAIGSQRLRSVLLDPDGPRQAASTECWMQLPAPERVLDSGFFMLDGAPVMIVTTMSSDKLNVFGEKALRVYALGTDRTRVGAPPSFAAVTGLNIWQEGHPFVTDLDHDGRDDLVIAYWKGLKSTIAALEVYRGLPAGGFAKPRTTEFDVKDADVGFLSFGVDLDDDGPPDLLVLAGRQAIVYPGAGGWTPGAKPVSEQPSRSVPLPPGVPNSASVSVAFGVEGVAVSRRAPGWGTPRLLDLDGDRRPELVLAGDAGTAARISVITFRGAGSDDSR